jgi:hypothetical protein
MSDIEQLHPKSEYVHPVHYSGTERRTVMFADSTDPDTMYLHEAMRESYKIQFLAAMQEEIQAQTKNGSCEVVPKSQLPENTRFSYLQYGP